MAVYTVSQIADYLKASLDGDSVLADVWVNGEVSNLSRSAAGHAYFTLKDARAQLRCVLFRRNRGAELLDNGHAVAAHGNISFYEVRGDIQLYVDLIRPEGMGALHLELERLKALLEEEGLFDPSRKRPLPSFPQHIGLVTSEQGAVFHDICNIIERRYPLAEVVLCAAAVQGKGAAPEIVDALRTLNAEGDVDVIIVARGGGSLEELWPFNEEAVARAIYASHAPVVSAVGHETDFTIADYVADVRAPTPSAAAELVVPDAAQLQAIVQGHVRSLSSNAAQFVSGHRQSVGHLLQRLHIRAPDIAGQRQRIDDLTALISSRLNILLERQGDRARNLQWRLAALDPRAVLARGYAVVAHEATGQTVTSPRQVAQGDPLAITVHEGIFGVEVRDGATSAG